MATTADARAVPMGQLEEPIRWIETERIVIGSSNVRSASEPSADLADSIRSVGVLHPLIVTPHHTSQFVLVCGYRRLHAAIEVGLDAVPCLIRCLSPAERLETMLIENLQRQTLSRIEEARAYKGLIDAGMSQREIAERVGKSAAHICRRVRLLSLSERDQQDVERRARPLNAALGYVARRDPYAVDEHLQRSWLALRTEVVRRNDAVLIRLLADFASAYRSRLEGAASVSRGNTVVALAVGR
jgi:ParB family transcriptional regulator, chromosome partitioning protein